MSVESRMKEIQKEYEQTRKAFDETSNQLQNLQNRMIYLEGAFAELKKLDDETKDTACEEACESDK